jgi:hypothetical protein
MRLLVLMPMAAATMIMHRWMTMTTTAVLGD